MIPSSYVWAFIVFVYIFFFLSFGGIMLGIKAWIISITYRPKASLYKKESDGSVQTYELITMEGGRWKLDSDNPSQVKYKIRTGLFSTIEQSCDRNDFVVRPRPEGKGIIVEMGIKNADPILKAHLYKLQHDADFEYNKASNLELENQEIMANVEKRDEKFDERYGSLHKKSQILVKAGGSSK